MSSKKHWTQTPAGRAKMRAIQARRWAKNTVGTGSGGEPSPTVPPGGVGQPSLQQAIDALQVEIVERQKLVLQLQRLQGWLREGEREP